MEYANVLLSAYRNLPQAIKAIKKNYFLRCENSKYFYTPTDVFASDLLDMLEVCEKLVVLKNKLDLMFSRFSEEERQLLRFKYEGIKPNARFDYSLRTYFRKQKKLLKKVELYLGYLGIDEHVFKTEYEKTDYFQTVICALKWQKRRRNLSSVAAAFDITRPKVAAAK